MARGCAGADKDEGGANGRGASGGNFERGTSQNLPVVLVCGGWKGSQKAKAASGSHLAAAVIAGCGRAARPGYGNLGVAELVRAHISCCVHTIDVRNMLSSRFILIKSNGQTIQSVEKVLNS